MSAGNGLVLPDLLLTLFVGGRSDPVPWAEGSEPAEPDLSFGKGQEMHLQTPRAKAGVSARIIVAILYWDFLSGNR